MVRITGGDKNICIIEYFLIFSGGYYDYYHTYDYNDNAQYSNDYNDDSQYNFDYNDDSQYDYDYEYHYYDDATLHTPVGSNQGKFRQWWNLETTIQTIHWTKVSLSCDQQKSLIFSF